MIAVGLVVQAEDILWLGYLVWSSDLCRLLSDRTTVVYIAAGHRYSGDRLVMQHGMHLSLFNRQTVLSLLRRRLLLESKWAFTEHGTSCHC